MLSPWDCAEAITARRGSRNTVPMKRGTALSTTLRGVIRDSRIKSLTPIFSGQITFILPSDTYLPPPYSFARGRHRSHFVDFGGLDSDPVLILTVIPNVITIVITGGSAWLNSRSVSSATRWEWFCRRK